MVKDLSVLPHTAFTITVQTARLFAFLASRIWNILGGELFQFCFFCQRLIIIMSKTKTVAELVVKYIQKLNLSLPIR